MQAHQLVRCFIKGGIHSTGCINLKIAFSMAKHHPFNQGLGLVSPRATKA